MSDNQPNNTPGENSGFPQSTPPEHGAPLTPPAPTTPLSEPTAPPAAPMAPPIAPAAPGAPYVAAQQAPQYPQQVQYPQAGPVPGYAPGPVRPKGLAITGMILGIAGLVFCWIPYLGPLLALTGIVISIIALMKKQSVGMGITGIVTGAIGLLIGVFITIAAMIAFGFLGAGLDAMQQCQNGADSVEILGETVSCSSLDYSTTS